MKYLVIKNSVVKKGGITYKNIFINTLHKITQMYWKILLLLLVKLIILITIHNYKNAYIRFGVLKKLIS